MCDVCEREKERVKEWR